MRYNRKTAKNDQNDFSKFSQKIIKIQKNHIKIGPSPHPPTLTHHGEGGIKKRALMVLVESVWDSQVCFDPRNFNLHSRSLISCCTSPIMSHTWSFPGQANFFICFHIISYGFYWILHQIYRFLIYWT